MACALGIPVVSTNVGGLAEMTQDDHTGYVVAPRDVEALARAVVTCLEPNTYARLSRNAREVARTTYGWERIAARTRAVYDRARGGCA